MHLLGLRTTQLRAMFEEAGMLTGIAGYPLFRAVAKMPLGMAMPNYVDNTAWALATRALNPDMYLILRPDDGSDEHQFDESQDPASEANRFAVRFIKPKLAAVPAGTYNAVTGPCETWHRDKLAWRAAFELALCKIVQDELRLDYIALSCPVGNLDAEQLPLFFEVFRAARWVGYHGYLGRDLVNGQQINRNRLDQEVDQWFLYRPTRIWHPMLQAAGIPLRIIYLEIGTGPRPADVGLTKQQLAQLDLQIVAALEEECQKTGVIFGGALPFAFGAEYDKETNTGMGADWNLDGYEELFESNDKWPFGQGEDMTLEEKVDQLLAQNHDIVEALIAVRENRWTGPGSFDGWIASLRGGQLPDDYAPAFPKASRRPLND